LQVWGAKKSGEIPRRPWKAMDDLGMCWSVAIADRRSVLDPVEFGHFFLFGREKMTSWCIFDADNHNFRIQFAPHEQFELQ